MRCRVSPTARPRTLVGQALVEFALVMALVVALSVPAFGYARAAIAATFHAQETALTAPPITASPTATAVAR